MRSTAISFYSIPFLISTLVSAISIGCDHIRVEKKKFDFSKIGGPHSVLHSDINRPPSVYNTTWTLDICQPLIKLKDIPNEDQCPLGTHVCGIATSWNPIDDPEQKRVLVENVIPVAGNYETSSGKSLNPYFTRLKTLDSETEGLQLEVEGGVYGGKKQKAVIHFQCDKNWTGNEGLDIANSKQIMTREAEKVDEPKNALSFVSYGHVDGKEDMDVLRLNWKTKYACEDVADNDDGDDTKKTGWGFFTWFILILFLGIATYLIFGSWLNYNRYGARGWDLLPHGDAIRDIPYMFKDWSRKVADTVQGGGVRGGYSAV